MELLSFSPFSEYKDNQRMPKFVSAQELSWQVSEHLSALTCDCWGWSKCTSQFTKQNKRNLTGNCKGHTRKKTLLGQAAVAEQELARQLPPAARPETAAKASASVSTPRVVELQPGLPLQGLELLWRPEKKPLQLPSWLPSDLIH